MVWLKLQYYSAHLPVVLNADFVSASSQERDMGLVQGGLFEGLTPTIP